MTSLFKRNVLHFQLLYVKVNDVFRILRKKRQRGMLLKKNWCFKIWCFDLNLAWPCVKCENECHHPIQRPKWPIKHVLHDFHAMFSHNNLVWPDLDLYVCVAWFPYIYGHLRHLLSNTLAEFGRAAVSGLVSEADKVKRVSFDVVWHDHDRIFDRSKKILWQLWYSLVESFWMPRSPRSAY